MTELKPCPFCGGKARVSIAFTHRTVMSNYERFAKYRVQIICNKCHSRGKPIPAFGLDEAGLHYRANQMVVFRNEIEKAIEAWNRRVNNDK